MPTLTLRFRQFSGGNDIVAPGMLSLTNNSSFSLTAPASIQIPDPGNPGTNLTFAFFFWNVKGGLTSTATANVPDVGTQAFNASAWYLQVGGGGGGGTPNVSTTAFSITQDLVLSDTPIQSVNPAAAWPGPPSTVVSTTGAAVQITAKNAIGAESFNSWLLFGPGSASAAVLSVPQNSFAIALATYAVPKPTRPNIPDLDLDLADILDGIRGRLKDWVFDPAPIDMLRLSGQFRAATKGPALEDVAELATRLDKLSQDQLKLLRTDLEARAGRLGAALKAVEGKLKGK